MKVASALKKKGNKNFYRGYHPLIKGDASWKEFYEHGSKEGTHLKTKVEYNENPMNDKKY